jgi:signal transduction histidine kinase
VIGVDFAASVASITTIEQTGRHTLARLREILGLLRAEHDPDGLSPLVGVEQLHDLIAAYRGAGTQSALEVSGVPEPLSAGLDILVYRIVEDVLAAAGATAHATAVSLRFSDESLRLDFTVSVALGAWAQPDTRDQIQRSGGRIIQTETRTGERITVELPMASAMVQS